MLSVVKTDEQAQARRLRAEGRSVKEITRQLGVARSSVSRWVQDVPLTEAQRAALEESSGRGRLKGSARNQANGRARREAYHRQGRERALVEDASYAAGCMLYWAEGDKCRHAVTLSNSDPDLLSYFADFLRTYFAVTDDQFRVHCNLFADHVQSQRDIEQFWLARLSLPISCLRKSMVNSYSKYSQKKRVNKLPYGTCKLVVHRTAIVQTIYGSIQEYGGFDRPAWLD
jgi:hypothetical protein